MADEALKSAQDDIETLMRDLMASGEWEDEHDDILARWRERRGEAGMGGWRWWWKLPDDERYQTDHATREEAIAAACRDEPGAATIELIEARCWADDIDYEHALFAATRNYERKEVAANG